MLVVVSVRHPRLPGGRLWLPCFSFLVYLLAWGARAAIRLAPKEKVPAGLPLGPARLGWLVTRAAEVLLWSGSYMLLEVTLPREGIGVKVRVL